MQLFLTPTPLTLKTASSTADTIQVDAGVKADLTLAGVTITTASSNANAPINLVTNVYDMVDNDGYSNPADPRKATNASEIRNKTMLYLTVADGTVNSITCGNGGNTGAPGIRCGWGSVLVIDDGITNVKQGGSKFNLDDIVTPENGAVPADVTLLDGTTLSKGDSLSKMATEKSVLNVQGGGHSAGIGSGCLENAGTIVINGGSITSKTYNNTGDWGASNGSGIGSGSGGSGTVMIFNGGNIEAYGGTCGTGIGAALGYYHSSHWDGTPKADAISIPRAQDFTGTTAQQAAKAEAAAGGYGFMAIPTQLSWFNQFDGDHNLQEPG